MTADPSFRQVIIIGAGVAGLSSAACLSAAHIDYTILERGPAILSALRRVDPSTSLLSPPRFSRLPFMRTYSGSDKRVSFRTLVEAVEEFSERHNLVATTGVDVTSVERDNGTYRVRYRADGVEGVARGQYVINCTGVISNPNFPSIALPTACSYTWKHSLEVRAEDLKGVSRLLVVGGGVSAAETLERWLEQSHDNDRAWLSLRSRFHRIPNPLLGVDIHYLIWLPEHLPVRWFGWKVARIPEPMIETKVHGAIRQGIIKRIPEVVEYSAGHVSTRDGRVEPDLIVFATGYKYSMRHFHHLVECDADGRLVLHNCESTREEGFFVLGYRFGRTFASPYIRGIERDARFIAREIARRIART